MLAKIRNEDIKEELGTSIRIYRKQTAKLVGTSCETE